MTATLLDEIAQYLAANGVGTLGINIFEGNLPDADGVADAAIAIFDTAGLPSDIEIPLHYPSFQILIRDIELDLGETKAQLIRTLLHNKYNLQFITNGTYVYACNLTSFGGHIGRDEKGRDEFSLNFQCRVR